MRYRKTPELKRTLIVEMLIAGISYKSIAEQMDISMATVGAIFRENKDTVEQGRVDRAQEAKARLQGMSQQAVDVLVDLLETGNPKQKLDVCKFVLSVVMKDTATQDPLVFIRSLIED